MSANPIIALRGESELTEVERLILAEIDQDESAYRLQPARIKIAPGGVGQFQVGDEMAKTFTAIVALSQIIRGYWPSSGTGEAPLCNSPDGHRGIFREPSDKEFQDATKTRVPHPGIIALSEKQPLPESYPCGYCPMNMWGSEHQRRAGQGKGKACKEMRRLLVIPDGWNLPAIFTLPPTSIGAWDAFCSAQAARRSAYFAVPIKFSLDAKDAAGGERYNVVNVAVAGEQVDAARLQMVTQIRKEFRDFVSQSPVEAVEYEVPAQESAAPPATGKTARRKNVDAATGEIYAEPVADSDLPF